YIGQRSVDGRERDQPGEHRREKDPNHGLSAARQGQRRRSRSNRGGSPTLEPCHSPNRSKESSALASRRSATMIVSITKRWRKKSISWSPTAMRFRSRPLKPPNTP